MRMYRETGAFTIKKSSGRPKKLTVAQEQQLVSAATQNNFVPIGKLKHYLNSDFPTLSRASVRKYLKDNGILTCIAAEKSGLSNEAIRTRLKMAEDGLERHLDVYSKTIFIDEFSIDTRSSRKRHVRRELNTRYVHRNLNLNKISNPKSLSFVVCFC